MPGLVHPLLERLHPQPKLFALRSLRELARRYIKSGMPACIVILHSTAVACIRGASAPWGPTDSLGHCSACATPQARKRSPPLSSAAENLAGADHAAHWHLVSAQHLPVTMHNMLVLHMVSLWLGRRAACLRHAHVARCARNSSASGASIRGMHCRAGQCILFRPRAS